LLFERLLKISLFSFASTVLALWQLTSFFDIYGMKHIVEINGFQIRAATDSGIIVELPGKMRLQLYNSEIEGNSIVSWGLIVAQEGTTLTKPSDSDVVLFSEDGAIGYRQMAFYIREFQCDKDNS
jgi:hypothetical protein